MKPKHGEIYYKMKCDQFREENDIAYIWVPMPEWVEAAGEVAVKMFDFAGFEKGHTAFLRPMTAYEKEMWEANTPEEQRKKNPVNSTLVNRKG